MDIQIKTKYDLNELVYVLYNNEAVAAKITHIHTITHTIQNHSDIIIKYYLVDADKLQRLGYYEEKNIFDSKKQLLENL